MASVRLRSRYALPGNPSQGIATKFYFLEVKFGSVIEINESKDSSSSPLDLQRGRHASVYKNVCLIMIWYQHTSTHQSDFKHPYNSFFFLK